MISETLILNSMLIIVGIIAIYHIVLSIILGRKLKRKDADYDILFNEMMGFKEKYEFVKYNETDNNRFDRSRMTFLNEQKSIRLHGVKLADIGGKPETMRKIFDSWKKLAKYEDLGTIEYLESLTTQVKGSKTINKPYKLYQ